MTAVSLPDKSPDALPYLQGITDEGKGALLRRSNVKFTGLYLQDP